MRPARAARLIAVLGALAVAVALGAAVATDARHLAGIAWAGTAAAAGLVALGALARSATPVHFAVGLLGAMLLLRGDSRLLAAPLYGAGLLAVEELVAVSTALSGTRAVERGVLWTQAAAMLVGVAVGACAAACAAIAVSVAPGRSVALTAVGALAALVAFGAIVLIARGRCGASDLRAGRGRSGGCE